MTYDQVSGDWPFPDDESDKSVPRISRDSILYNKVYCQLEFRNDEQSRNPFWALKLVTDFINLHRSHVRVRRQVTSCFHLKNAVLVTYDTTGAPGIRFRGN